jgi:hypothetical protein
LESVDFASLDVARPSDLFELTYHDDGRPIRRREAKIADWLAQVKKEGEVEEADLALLRAAGVKVEVALVKLQSIEMMVNVREWRAAHEGLRRALGQQGEYAVAVKDGAARALNIENGLTSYVRSLS